MSKQRVTWLPSQLVAGPRPTENEVFIKTPFAGPFQRPGHGFEKGGMRRG